MPNDATVTREETELIFSGHRVYKLFTTPSVTIDVLNDLLRLDNKMNTKPVISWRWKGRPWNLPLDKALWMLWRVATYPAGNAPET